ncbi:hypothetical protein [Brevibacillus agri]|uniref:hypothetical protein n=1 Tax=Brevibacillus agri TaxID=51101 RepID=UPI001013D398|nr:hypothetical protein [Brevibacillus agri]
MEIERIAALMNDRKGDRTVFDRSRKEAAGWQAESRQAEMVAGRFAAKEAGAESARDRHRHALGFLDMEITPSETGKPMMRVDGDVLTSSVWTRSAFAYT